MLMALDEVLVDVPFGALLPFSFVDLPELDQLCSFNEFAQGLLQLWGALPDSFKDFKSRNAEEETNVDGALVITVGTAPTESLKPSGTHRESNTAAWIAIGPSQNRNICESWWITISFTTFF
jgi:hypothetical protein